MKACSSSLKIFYSRQCCKAICHHRLKGVDAAGWEGGCVLGRGTRVGMGLRGRGRKVGGG